MSADYFSMLGFEPAFAIDLAQLQANYRELQRTLHPDRFVGESAQQQRLAVGKSALLNDAFTTLKDPVKRGRYLLLENTDIEFNEQGTFSDPELLMTQMELRESLDTLRVESNLDGLEDFVANLGRQMSSVEAELETQFNDQPWQAEQLKKSLMHLQFLQRVNADAELALEAAEEAQYS